MHTGGAWERMIGVARWVLEAMLVDVSPKHLTHEVLTTLMAEVSARPLVSVSNDPNAPEVLTPATLLTHKPQHLKPPAGEFSAPNLSHKQWKCVQHQANVFCSWWRREYLPTLQPRRKWQNTSHPSHQSSSRQWRNGAQGGLSNRLWRLKEAFQTPSYRNHPAAVRDPMNPAGSLALFPLYFLPHFHEQFSQ